MLLFNILFYFGLIAEMEVMMEQNEEEKNEIEVVTGDDSELEISTVYDHLNLDKMRETPSKQNIIIPEVKKDDKE